MSYSVVANEDATLQSQRPAPNRPRADLWSRLAPFLFSLLSALLGVIPLALQLSHYTYDSNTTLYHLAVDHRNSTQVIVSIISAVLAFLWSFSVCGAFNMFVRSWIAKHGSMSLNWLRLDIAIAHGSTEFKRPVWLIIASLLWFALGQFPAQLWTGALTPGITNTVIMKENSVPVTQVNFQNQSLFTQYGHELGPNDVPAAGHCGGSLSLPNGTFHSCPGSVFSGRIVESLRSASTVNGTLRNHTKLDKSGFNYIGRSYGAGSSVGVIDLPVGAKLDSYSFLERGYFSSATCSYNASSAWGILPTPLRLGNVPSGIPAMFWAQGKRTNDDFTSQAEFSVSYPVLSFNLFPDRILAFSAGGCCGKNTGQAPFSLAITTGANYTLFNNTQCELKFTPSTFNVTVAPTNGSIKVEPQQNDTAAVTDPSEYLEWTVRNLQSITQTQTTLFISTVAEALIDNVATKTGVYPDYNLTTPPNPLQLQAVAESIDAALDDVMEALNAWGLVVPGGWTTQTALVSKAVVSLGTSGWNIALFAFNLGAFVIIAGVTAYTKLFEGSPAFDFADLTSIIGAACSITGARGVADDRGTPLIVPPHLAGWTGNANDKSLKSSVIEFDSNIGVPGPPHVTIQSELQEYGYRHRDGQAFELTNRRSKRPDIANHRSTESTLGH